MCAFFVEHRPTGCARMVTPTLRREEPMKRRTFVAGTTALVGLSALPWRVTMAGHKGESGTPKPGGTLRVAFASDIHAGRFQLNRLGDFLAVNAVATNGPTRLYIAKGCPALIHETDQGHP